MKAIDVIGRLAAPDEGPMHHRFVSSRGSHILVVPHSRIYDVEGGEPTPEEIRALALPQSGEVPLDSVVAPAPQAISLNVSSVCNLSCSYCYAGQGSFGGAQRSRMSLAIAHRAITLLFEQADRSRPVTIGFIGGEPLASRNLVHEIVAFAEARARSEGIDVRFSITTNGTLVEERDRELFRNRRFAVTVSIDGDAATHDSQRPRLPGHGSFSDLVTRVRPLLERPGRAQVSARATVMAPFADLRRRFATLVEIGFKEIGFSPLRQSPTGIGVLEKDDWPRYLAELVGVARGEADRARRGLPIRLTNLSVALDQLRRGASSPYPCGAGGGYFSVASDGRWYACHRGVGDAAFELGDQVGLDGERRRSFLERRHVHAQEACRTCFARYLCSGGCHHEASSRNDSSCGFIRGWLEFCLATYCEMEDA